MMKYIADEFGIDWICNPLNCSNETLFFETSRGWNETRWIVLSSTFFSIPAIWHLTNYYLYVASQCITDENEKYIQTIIYISVILLTTSLISANYWRKATRGWRRNLDLTFSKFTFLTCSYYGFKYTTYYPYLIIVIGGSPMLPYLYWKSSKLISENNLDWVKYHFMFHIVLTITIAFLLDGTRMRMNE